MPSWFVPVVVLIVAIGILHHTFWRRDGQRVRIIDKAPIVPPPSATAIRTRRGRAVRCWR